MIKSRLINSHNIKKTILTALIIGIILGFVFIISQDRKLNSSQNDALTNLSTEEVLGSSVDFCNVLGLETGVVESKPRDFEKYYDVNLSVITTVVCRGEEDQAISEVKNSPALKNHVVRLIGRYDDDCFFNPDQASSFIARLRKETANLPFDVFVMPINEPRTDLEPFLGTDPIIHVNWLSSIMENLKSNGNEIVSNTKDYVLFPAFNYHNPDGSNSNDYISRFIINYSGDINNDFYAMSVSIHKENGYPPIVNRMQRFSQLLVDLQVSNSKLALFSANVVNVEADENYIKELHDVFREYKDNLIGVYIFSPWGWDYSQSGLVKNLPIPDYIWNRLFENCSSINRDNEYSCRENFVDTLAPLRSCETLGPENHVFGGVRVGKNSLGKRVALPIITVEAEMTFLNWLADSNYLNKLIDQDFDGPPVGTFENRIKAPCAVDRFLVQNPNFDMTKVFSGTIKLKAGAGEEYDFDYKMPGLGNALACMIWNPNDFSSDSYPLSQLESRFYSEGFINYDPLGYREGSKELLKESFESIDEWLSSFSERLAGNRTYCSGLVSRVDESDSFKGPEMIISDGEIDLSDDNTICNAIKLGHIDIGRVRFDQICIPQADGQYKYVEGLANPYYRVAYGPVNEIEILGGNKALASMWLEEAQNNPWRGIYDIIHRDKAGVKVKVKQSLYDGLSNNKSYKSPLSTNDQCTLFEYDGDKELSPLLNYAGVPGSIQKETEYIVPWLGQILNIQKRESLVFASYRDVNITSSNTTSRDEYLEKRSKIIRDFIQKDDEVDLEKLGKILYQILYPVNIFRCEDLSSLSSYLLYKREGSTDPYLQKQIDTVLTVINRTDCLAPKDTKIDPLNQWLCEQGLIDTRYCKLACIPAPVLQDFSEEKNSESGQSNCPVSECSDVLSTGINNIPYPTCNENIRTSGTGMNNPNTCDSLKKQEKLFGDRKYVGINFMGTNFKVHEKMVPFLNRAESIINENYKHEEVNGRTVYYFPSYPEGYIFIGWGGASSRGGNHGLGVAIDISGTIPSRIDNYDVSDSTQFTDWGNWRISQTGRCDVHIPPEFVYVMESVGLRWGGRFSSEGGGHCNSTTGECFDPMHFELVPNCIVDKSKLSGDNLVLDSDSNVPTVSGESDKGEYCTTENGKYGIIVKKSSIPENFNFQSYFSGFKYANEDLEALHNRIVNMCGVQIPDCNVQCRDDIKQAVLRVADFNNTKGYSNDEISYFIDRMYEETQNMTQMNFQTLIAMWLAENGLNPRHKNDLHPSDIFGCGVYCREDKPQNFEEELACTLGKPYPDNDDPQCGVFYPFEPESPGNYLEAFAPISDGNLSYSEKVILVLERLLLLQGVPIRDLRIGDLNSCYLYPRDYDESLLVNSTWVGDILDQIYAVEDIERFYTRGK